MKQSYLKQTKDPNVAIRMFLIAIYIVLSFFEYYTLMSFGSITRYYIFLVIAMILLTSDRLHIRFYHYTVIGWLLYKFLSLIWTPSYVIFSMHALSEVGFVLLLVCITSLDEGEPLLKVFEKTTFVCSAILGVLSLLFNNSFEGFSERKVLTLFGRQLDPNNIAAFLLFGLALAIHYFLYEKKHRLLYTIIIAINCYTTMLTGSRAGLVTIFLIFFVSFVSVFDKQTFRENYRRVLLLVAIIIIAGILMMSILPEEVFVRLFEFDDYEGGSSRDVIWAHGLQVLSNPIHLIMGAGWGGYKADGPTSLHNTFLSILCDSGILGILLLFSPLFYMLTQMLKKRKFLPFTMFVSSMAPAFFIESINKRFFWNAIIYVMIAYNCFVKEQLPEKGKQL